VRGLADVVQTIRDISGHGVILTMIVLGGAAAFFVGNAYNAQMPGFAADLGHGDPGIAYSALLAADAAGALLAGLLLESRAILVATPRTAIVLAMVWAAALGGFAVSTSYPLAMALLFVAGFFELAFNSMAQALVQLNAPMEMRGRVIGLYNMASMGLRTFSGVTIGLVGGLIGVHWSLVLFAMVMLALASALLGLGAGRRSAL
jgi:MFS family permease